MGEKIERSRQDWQNRLPAIFAADAITELAAASTCRELRPEVDDLVALMVPEIFYGVGQWYEDFRETSDVEASKLLRARKASGGQEMARD